MSSVLKGNYDVGKKIEAKKNDKSTTLEQRFEKEALKKLGGSIAYVAKKKVSWDLNE